MKQIALISSLILALGTSAAHAGCQAEYKAKRDNPLELFYDVAQISGRCTVPAATVELRARLAAAGLTLLKVLSVKES
ncbi:hypothetical protein [Roseovarius nubinhibens]|uniref:Uncharacterized protein n=1 Tax=Roseovarius nubinhibens TaxID=314263 RepID=A0A348WHZ2_9RHOB|nr:hypothetical protein [Roseovarius nubinhibens]